MRSAARPRPRCAAPQAAYDKPGAASCYIHVIFVFVPFFLSPLFFAVRTGVASWSDIGPISGWTLTWPPLPTDTRAARLHAGADPAPQNVHDGV
jgi:hypothetical protein